jgi:hypothetical protein
MVSKFEALISEKIRKYGNDFNASDLNPSFIPYYENQQRITVSFCNKQGKEYERKRGRIGITTGWKPCFLLMLTTRSLGSSWTIGKRDKIIL